VEPGPLANTSRMGDGSTHLGQRRRELHLVAVANALAESEQPPCSPALLRQHEDAYGEGLHADAPSIGTRHG